MVNLSIFGQLESFDPRREISDWKGFAGLYNPLYVGQHHGHGLALCDPCDTRRQAPRSACLEKGSPGYIRKRLAEINNRAAFCRKAYRHISPTLLGTVAAARHILGSGFAGRSIVFFGRAKFGGFMFNLTNFPFSTLFWKMTFVQFWNISPMFDLFHTNQKSRNVFVLSYVLTLRVDRPRASRLGALEPRVPCPKRPALCLISRSERVTSVTRRVRFDRKFHWIEPINTC